MNIKRLRTILTTPLLAFAITACGTIPVDEYNASTQVNSEVQTLRYSGFDRFCSSRPPHIRIIAKPMHGELSIRPGKVTISAGPADIGTKGNCVGKTVTGKYVFYVPAKGFRGRDEFLLESTFAGTTGVARKNVTVIVR